MWNFDSPAFAEPMSVEDRPTIERGSYGDRGVLGGNRPDGVGKAGEDVVSTTPKFYAPVAIDRGLAAHGARGRDRRDAGRDRAVRRAWLSEPSARDA